MPESLDDTEIAAILGRIDALVSWADDIKEYALKEALSGKHYEGFKVVEGRSVRKYTSEEEAAKAVTEAGYDPYEKKVYGITAMTALLGRKRFEEVLGSLVCKAPGKPTLVEESDKRPALDTAKKISKQLSMRRKIMTNTKTKLANPMKVVTGIDTRWSYVNAWEPKSIEGSEPKYSVSLIIPKTDTRTVARIRAAIQAAYKDGESKLKGNGKSVPALDLIKNPLRDGDRKRPMTRHTLVRISSTPTASWLRRLWTVTFSPSSTGRRCIPESTDGLPSASMPITQTEARASLAA